MNRRIVLDIKVPDNHGERILLIATQLCDFMDKLKETDMIDDYGLAFEYPKLDIVNLPTDRKKTEDIGHGAAEEVNTAI